MTKTEKRILTWMLIDLGMVLILCGKLLRKWGEEFAWGFWRGIDWGVGVGLTVAGAVSIAAACYLVWKYWKNTWSPAMTAFMDNEPAAQKTASEENGTAADSETEEAARARQMKQLQFEARAAAETEKEQLYLKKSEKLPNELLILIGGFTLYQWIRPFRHSYISYSFAARWPNAVGGCIQTGVLLFLVCGIFLLCAGILLYRYTEKQLKETFWIVQEIERYKVRTSLEKQLAAQSRWPFRIALVLELLIFITMLAGLADDWDSEVMFVLIFVMTALILILFAWKTHRSRLNREMGLLMEQIHTMAEGSMESRINEISEKSLLYPAFAELENIESAMQKSVEKQMQAERLKIDLITNVSHDLKTPLTSMVGYTDLLKKEDLTPAAQDYVEVISTKQEQLKEMIQSLFELSKSTSGTEKFQMEKMDMKRLIEQTLADMDDAIAQSGLSFRTSLGEEPLPFLGDNGKMYRVVQNLVENILKYSLDGTRVYIDAGKENGEIFVTMKNISAYEMNFEAEEMMERFVRGDKSRTSEGHGLGLAIASSYTANMGGRMELATDGDLFKVTLHFPEADENLEK
ncbi:sensor histidine kinase [Fusicatenibacter sp.]